MNDRYLYNLGLPACRLPLSSLDCFCCNVFVPCSVFNSLLILTPFPPEDYLISGELKSDRKYFSFGES
jgi:hypothetical protein